MRLPLRHAPPPGDAPAARCAHLEALARAAVGLPLGPAAALVASQRSRGRHGNALQWHFGLSPHDSDAMLDWEDRIELKLVSVWRRPRGGLICDKLKVCDAAMDPWRKLSNVLWVFADRLTRVVVGAATWRLAGPARVRLAESWHTDPHFGSPLLFVEARETAGKASPAYYLASRFFEDCGVLPNDPTGVFGFDAAWWTQTRAEHGRDPLITIAPGNAPQLRCPRCGGPVRVDPERLEEHGWSPAHHGMPLGNACAARGHLAVAAPRLRVGAFQTQDEYRAGLEARLAREDVWRLADRVPEPEDHEH